MAIIDKLTAVADAIRGKTGKTDKMTLDQMLEEIGGIGSGDIKALIERTITEVDDDTIEVVGANAFRGCAKLTAANFPNCKTVGTDAFNGCTSLTSFNFDSVTFIAATAFVGAFAGAKLYIPNNPTLQYNALAGCSMTELYAPNLKSTGVQAFQGCKSLVKAELPALTRLDTSVLGLCSALKVADFTALSFIANAFAECYELCALVIRNENEICALNGSLYYTKIASGEGYVYVPRVFLDDADETKDYRMATNWAAYPTQFRALEDYTIDGTVTGKFLFGNVSYVLAGVTSSNTDVCAVGSYQTTLSFKGDTEDVLVTVDGLDVTKDVYNSETKEVLIPRVTGDVVINASSRVDGILLEPGSIDWSVGTDTENSTRLRSGFIPYDPANNTFRADVTINGNTTGKARILLRPYKADGTFVATNFAGAISPAAVSGYALSGTQYTFNIGNEVAYVRVILGDSSDVEITSLTGTITVSGVTHNLIW